MRSVKITKQKKSCTTARDFSVFCEECRYWIKYFGLFGYRWCFVHEHFKGCRAGFGINDNSEDRVATCVFAQDWGHDVINNHNIREAAFHEVLEGLLWFLRSLMNEKLADNSIHRIIHMFENTVFEDSYNQRFQGKQ